jgi:hypothetical protein
MLDTATSLGREVAQEVSSQSVCEKPERIEIHGESKSLESLLEEFAGIWEISEWNRVHYRVQWRRFLPRRRRDIKDGKPVQSTSIVNKDWCVAYDPIVAVRRCYPSNSKPCLLTDLPYFVVILNSARDERPRLDTPSVVAASVAGTTDGKDPLQRNLIDRDMIIAEFGDFYLTPNGYPYHRYASLLVAKDEHRRQEYPTPGDIDTWMRFSILTKQYVFFNSPHAGASIPARLHAQVVDPEGIRSEDRTVVYPLLNPNTTVRQHIRPGIEKLSGYGIEALVLRGRDAPHRASLAIKKLRDEEGHWYNIMVKEKEVFIVARNADKETSHCIGKKVGAYEMSGVILVGNIEEPLLERLDLDRVVSGAEVFSQLNYEQISSNIANATASLGNLEHKL